MSDRSSRLSGQGPSKASGDTRTPFEIDRDRILYSEYFRRLEQVTQVASAADGDRCHNRLVHSLKVAQVARRLAERLVRDAKVGKEVLDPDVVEAAALAHDLGHPPFGHVAEKELDTCAKGWGLPDGFEGNAQSFRIITKLAIHRAGSPNGLDLTRATLCASVKYPWARGKPGDKTHAKFGHYEDDEPAFTQAFGTSSISKTLEAQVMDYADDVTYSIHDLEDFFRAGLIPVDRIVQESGYRNAFIKRVRQRKPEIANYLDSNSNFEILRELLNLMLDEGADSFHGARVQSEILAEFRSAAITKFLEHAQVVQDGNDYRLDVSEGIEKQQDALKQLIWDFVILNPRLAQQQCGQRKIIRTIFEFFATSLGVAKNGSKLKSPRPEAFPALMAGMITSDWDKRQRVRFAIDATASLSEPEAVRIYQKIEGISLGSALGPI